MHESPTISICSNPLPHSHVAALAEIEDGYWWFEGRSYWAARLVDAALKSSGLTASQATYLDLGCGTGGFAQSLSEVHGFRKTVLVDGDPKVLELASRYPGFQIQQVDFNLDFKLPAEAAIMTCMDVIEHLPNDEDFLRKVAKQMPANGNLILSVPAYPAFYSEWDRQLGHFRRYTPAHLRSLLKKVGLKEQFLSPMWSFLAPLAPIRKMKAAHYQESMDFERAPKSLNSLLLQFSKMEWAFAKWFRMPVGTSLIAWVKKNG